MSWRGSSCGEVGWLPTKWIDVEALRELDERDVVVQVPGPPAADAVVDGRRPGDQAERDLVAADVEPPRRVPRRDREPLRRASRRACSTTSRGIRASPVSSSTMAPAARKASRAAEPISSTPISSSSSSEASWIVSTWSSLSSATGASAFRGGGPVRSVRTRARGAQLRPLPAAASAAAVRTCNHSCSIRADTESGEDAPRALLPDEPADIVPEGRQRVATRARDRRPERRCRRRAAPRRAPRRRAAARGGRTTRCRRRGSWWPQRGRIAAAAAEALELERAAAGEDREDHRDGRATAPGQPASQAKYARCIWPV